MRASNPMEQVRRRNGRASHQNRSGSIAGGIHRAWIDVKTVLGGGDQTILSSVEAGEDAAVKSYREALEQPTLPEHLATLIRKQLVSIQAAHDHVRSLRDTKAA